MSSERTVVVIVRCIAAYGLIPFSSALAVWLTVALGSPDLPDARLLVADGTGAALRLLLVVGLWLAAPALGRRISPPEGATRAGGGGFAGLAALGFGLVGILLAGPALGDIASSVAQVLTFSPPPGGAASMNFFGLWTGIAQLILGVAVFCGRRPFAAAFVALRRA